MRIGYKATQIAIAGFVVPYMAIYDPALMLQGDWTFLTVAYVAFKAVLAISLWAVMTIGYLWQPVGLFGRVFAFVAAAMLSRRSSLHRRNRLRDVGSVHPLAVVQEPQGTRMK